MEYFRRNVGAVLATEFSWLNQPFLFLFLIDKVTFGGLVGNNLLENNSFLKEIKK